MSSLLRIMLLLIVFFSAPLSHAGEKDTTTILLFGDSIIAGYGLKTAESVPVRLQEILQKEYDVQVINGGVSGDTSGAGRGRLAWTLDKYQPDIVILALGGNDVLRGIPPHITQENIMAMLALLKEQNVTTVLSAVQAPDNLGIEYREKFNSIYTQAAEQYDVESYPFLISDTFGNKKLMQSDAIHPNAPGAALIAKKLASFLKKFL